MILRVPTREPVPQVREKPYLPRPHKVHRLIQRVRSVVRQLPPANSSSVCQSHRRPKLCAASRTSSSSPNTPDATTSRSF